MAAATFDVNELESRMRDLVRWAEAGVLRPAHGARLRRICSIR